MSTYNPNKRSARVHKRIVRQGTERFDADDVKLELADEKPRDEQLRDDDARILGELPPHWAVFESRSK